tara:strand:+ start:1255 stop:1470 length:216 start_codon:yes stop_codon:yes gene_type:complete
MKLHETLVEFLVKTYEINSGWTEERKLKEALRSLDFSVYTQQDGTEVLVSKKQLDEARKKIELELGQRRGS